jgi:zinc protease
MKTTGLCLALASVMTLGFAQPERPKTQEGAIALSDSSSPFVAFNIWVKTGSQHDPKGKEGLAALTANLLAEGATRQDTYEEILTKLYPMAAGYDYSVDKEMTTFSGRVHRDNLEPYYTLLKNVVLSPAFREDDFTRVKTQILSYLTQARRFSNDEELSKELLYREIFRNTPYEHPEEGFVTSVETITLDDVKAFYARFYTRENVVAGVAGGYPESFVSRIRGDLDTLPAGTVTPPPKPAPAVITGMKVLIVEKNTNATPISFGFPISLLRSDPDFYAMMLVNSWLGEHRTAVSHLYQVIRATRGLNYGDYTYIEAYPRGFATQVPPVNVSRRSQIFEAWIRPVAMTAPGTLHDRALFALRAAVREIATLVATGMTPETFEAQRRYLKSYSVNFGVTISRRLAYRIDDAFYGISGPGFFASLGSGLDALTVEKVNAAIKKHLQARNMWVVLITQDAQGMKKTLLEGAKTTITYAGKQPREVLDEDKIIASYPIPVRAADVTILNINEVFEN